MSEIRGKVENVRRHAASGRCVAAAPIQFVTAEGLVCDTPKDDWSSSGGKSERKFRALVGDALGAEHADVMLAAIKDLDSDTRISKLMRLEGGRSAAA